MNQEQLDVHAHRMRNRPTWTPHIPPRVREVLDRAATDYGCSVKEITGGSRVRHIMMARCQAGQVLTLMGFSLTVIARYLHVDHSSVVHMNKKAALVPSLPIGDIPVPDLSGEWAI